MVLPFFEPLYADEGLLPFLELSDVVEVLVLAPVPPEDADVRLLLPSDSSILTLLPFKFDSLPSSFFSLSGA
jgi:hypothetical protein